MALDVNGYSSQFANFLDFAKKQITTDEKKGQTSIAQIDSTTHTITANTNDIVGKWGARSQDVKDANNTARDIFKKAIAEMFGGEKNIPKSVLNAMKLSDYGKGKPLTARRILAVKNAIDTDGTAKLNAFKSADAATVALNKGWNQTELLKVARAANFLSAATGVDEFTAIDQLSTPGSKANRLMNYGGRFLDSAENFANGLRLMDSFADWFKDIGNTMEPVYKKGREERDYSPANTFSKLNFNSKFTGAQYVKGFEKFVFEELSIDPKANLAETDMEKLFGMKNNKVVNFFGHGFGSSISSTIDSIPKEKRAVIYTAINAFTKPANNALEAKEKNKMAGNATWLSDNHSPEVVARLLRNFDKAEAMYNSGKLTAKNIIKEFFAEIPDKGNYDHKTIDNYLDNINTQLSLDEDEGGQYTDVASGVTLAMENSGYTFEETVASLRAGQMPPVPKYLCTGSMPLEQFDGTTSGGRTLIEGDLYRPDACYRFKNDLKTPLLDTTRVNGFGFTFPGEDKFYTDGTAQGRANIQRVGDKVIEMCGAVHVNQANSVMMMLSQSGLSNLRAGIPQVNSTSNEHAPVNYSLTKNKQTGDITIKYSSPEELPFKFEWTATVDVNGNVTSTPMTVEKKSLAPELVASTLDNAATRMNVNLTDAQKANASKLIGELGLSYKLEGKKLDLFANFVARLTLTDRSAKTDTKYATDMAMNISKWTEFEVGKGEEIGVGAVETAIKNTFNEIIDDSMADAAKGDQSGKFKNGTTISQDMVTDANRGTYIFNGQTIENSTEKVIEAFKNTVTNPNMQRGLSSILHQISILTFTSLSMRGPMAITNAHPENNAGTLPGIEKIVSRDMQKVDYQMPIIQQSNDFSYNLQVNEDGTATYTVQASNPLVMGAGPDVQATFGSASYQCTFQINLTGDKPVITETKLSQTFDA